MDAGMIRTIGERVASPEYRGNPSPLSTQSKDVRSRRKAKTLTAKCAKKGHEERKTKGGFKVWSFRVSGSRDTCVVTDEAARVHERIPRLVQRTDARTRGTQQKRGPGLPYGW
jgi:hypothetical protein